MTNVKDVVDQEDRDLRKEARELLRKRHLSADDLAEALNVKRSIASRIIRELRLGGANIVETDGKHLLHDVLEPGGRLVLRPKDRGDGWTVFGFITDVHQCSRHSRADVLAEAYQTFAAEGVTEVFDAGNWIDGEARFNRQELIVFGLDDQLDYLIQNRPSLAGITTYYVSGDDHEGWYAQRERVNVGHYLELKAKKAGREDLKFIGHVEADVELKAPGGSAEMRVMHPGGGSSYAFSYAPQKLVESFSAGEKPRVLLIGHYHKRDVCYPREVHVISGGCVQDQTMFMRKNKIAAHVGFTIVKIKQDPDRGQIVRLAEEWFPRYDRKFYEQRY